MSSTRRNTDKPAKRNTFRLPEGLDKHLDALAAQQNVSKNTLVVGLLAGATSWKPASA